MPATAAAGRARPFSDLGCRCRPNALDLVAPARPSEGGCDIRCGFGGFQRAVRAQHKPPSDCVCRFVSDCAAPAVGQLVAGSDRQSRRVVRSGIRDPSLRARAGARVHRARRHAARTRAPSSGDCAGRYDGASHRASGNVDPWWSKSAMPGAATTAVAAAPRVPIAWLYGRLPRESLSRAGAQVLLLFSMAITLAILFELVSVRQEADGSSALLQWMSPTWQLWSEAPTYVEGGVGAATARVTVWLAVCGIAAWLFSRLKSID